MFGLNLNYSIFTLIFLLLLLNGFKSDLTYLNEASSDLTTTTTKIFNKNFIHHNNAIQQKSSNEVDINQQIFINQSNNIYILAKYGQTVSLPCVIYRQKNQDLSNIHTIWNKLNDKQRPIVLSIGLQQLKQDMRYRVKAINLNKPKQQHLNGMFSDSSSDENEIKTETSSRHRIMLGEDNSVIESYSEDQLSTKTSTHMQSHLRTRYSIQNWQLEIRKLTYDDAGTYQCLLPLVKPITRNVTLQVIPDLTIEPREGSFRLDDKIIIKCKTTIKYQQKHSGTHHLNQRQQKPNIHWYKENEMIKSTMNSRSATNDHKIEIETRQDYDENLLNSVLTIHHAKLDDSGKYKCTYDNIQEQVEVKVINDFYEYNKYSSSEMGSNESNRVLVNRFYYLMFIIIVKINFFFNY